MSQPSGKRRKSRELAMQMLFQADVGKQTPDQVRQSFWKAREEAIDNDTRGFAEDLFRVATVREPSSTINFMGPTRYRFRDHSFPHFLTGAERGNEVARLSVIHRALPWASM